MAEAVGAPSATAMRLVRESLLVKSRSPFECLGLLVSLRTGDEWGHLRDELYGHPDEILYQRSLAKLHEQVFFDWIETPLADQKIAVREHLRAAGELTALAAGEICVGSFAQCVPGLAELPERQLFEADLSAALLLIGAEQGEHEYDGGLTIWRFSAALQAIRASIGFAALTLSELSASLEVSAGHLGRSFHALAGVTFHEYQLAAHMSAAAHLLRSGPISVKEVAARVGFSNESNFRRAFRNSYHTRPTCYRLRFIDPL